MTVAPVNHRTGAAATRNLPALLLVLALLFVVQTGLVPYDLFRGAKSTFQAAFFIKATNHATYADIVANIFLYAPLGFLFSVYYWERRLNAVAALVAAVASSIVVSVGIEWLQAYSPARVSSMIDVTANAAGAALGAVAAGFWRALFPTLVGAILHELSSTPRMAVCKVYAGLLLFVALMPFSIAMSSEPLKRAVSESHPMPFASVTAFAEDARIALRVENSRAYEMAKWAILKRCSRWVAEFLSFVVLAWLIAAALRDEFDFDHRTSIMLTCWATVMAAVFLSMVQLPVVSRGMDGTDVVFRILGVPVGLIARWWWVGSRSATGSVSQGPSLRWIVPRLTIAVFAYIAYNSLIPFTFDSHGTSLNESMSAMGFPPLFAYFQTRADLMLGDVMEKFCSYALLGGLISYWWTQRAGATQTQHGPMCAVTCMAFCAVLEVIQAWIPIRVTTLSDPIVAGCGALIGVAVQVYAVAIHRYARVRVTIGQVGERDRPVLSATDELIASLADPYPDAPTEGRPTAPKVPRRF